MYIYFDESGNLDTPRKDNKKGLFFITALVITKSKPLKIAIKRVKKRIGKSQTNIKSIKGTASSVGFKKKYLKELEKQCKKMDARFYLSNFAIDARKALKEIYYKRFEQQKGIESKIKKEEIKTVMYTSICQGLITRILEKEKENELHEINMIFNQHHYLDIGLIKFSTAQIFKMDPVYRKVKIRITEKSLTQDNLLLGVDLFCTGFRQKWANKNTKWHSMFEKHVVIDEEMSEY